MNQVTSPAVAPRCDLSVTDATQLYTSDDYLELTGGSWHLEDSPFKANYIDQVVQRHELRPQTVCEIGCGAGGVLAELQKKWMPGVQFHGFDISPQAIQLSKRFANESLHFEVADALMSDNRYDLVLVMDVIEHIEDCFGFLRRCREKGDYKLYHIPIEITCTTALRDIFGPSYELGHIHHFSVSSALAALRLSGHAVIDYLFTPVGLERGTAVRTRAMNLVRRVLPTVLATRLVGGYSLMVLAK